MEEINKGFMRRIKQLRSETGLNGEDFGKIFGVSKVTIHRWEIGTNFPNQDLMLKLCDYFNVSLDYLMGRTDQRRAVENITADDFTIAFSNLQSELSEDDKQVILSLAQTLAEKRKK